MIEWNNKAITKGFSPMRPDPSVHSEHTGSMQKDDCSDKENKELQRAEAKAMQFLLYRQRTEKELREKLREKEFSSEAVENAVAYVKSFGYLDDRKYAEVYLHSQKTKKGRAVIRRELQEKGVDSEWIDLAFEEEPEDGGEIIYTLLCKRAGEPHELEEKELRRHVQYLARKGFPVPEIWKQVRRYQES